FDRYGKLKRTYEALTGQLAETKEEMEHLDSISNALDIALNEEDLVQIKAELTDYGYIRKHGNDPKNNRKRKITSKPFHYLSSDGYHIYVGKNNFQNEELTFKFASGNDWWFHAKGIAGSHVIVKSEGKEELPDRVFEEAGALAAYYSKNRDMDKVDVDYIQKKHVKKPNSQKPGFVIYHTNYSLTIAPDIRSLTLLED
ncbi:MAG: NFACT RNA binding domain-containing protein, partial [Acetivibrio ethanolgignens]